VGRRHITTIQPGALIYFAAAALLSTRPAWVAFESRPDRHPQRSLPAGQWNVHDELHIMAKRATSRGRRWHKVPF